MTPDLLDGEVRRDLRGLPKDLADTVARHLVAVGELLDEDPEAALAHARFARNRASRVAVVREASGLAAYHAGEWAEALSELRASRRMGGAAHVAVMADAERALGRPERALEIFRSPESRDLPRDEAMELLIVTSGARRDLGEFGAAVVGLQVPELDVNSGDPWTPRLFYAYGEALLAAGRREDAVKAFLDAAQTDLEGETDAEERAALVAAGVDEPPGALDDDMLASDDPDEVTAADPDEVPAADPDEVPAADPDEVTAADAALTGPDGGTVADGPEDVTDADRDEDDLPDDPSDAELAEEGDDVVVEPVEDGEERVAEPAAVDDVSDLPSNATVDDHPGDRGVSGDPDDVADEEAGLTTPGAGTTTDGTDVSAADVPATDAEAPSGDDAGPDEGLDADPVEAPGERDELAGEADHAVVGAPDRRGDGS